MNYAEKLANDRKDRSGSTNCLVRNSRRDTSR